MNRIKLFIMDVDGTLTDGKIYMGNDGEVMKAFSAKDGYGITQILPRLGIIPVIITGRTLRIVENRAAELKITEIHQGVFDKVGVIQSLMEQYGCCRDHLAYIGDDLNDFAGMECCGLTACPADGHKAIRQAVDYVCEHNGGDGAVRDFIDFIEEQYEASSDPVR